MCPVRPAFEVTVFDLKRGGRQYSAYVFAGQGVAMQVSIAIMRAFVATRRLLSSDDALARKILDLDQRYDAQFEAVFDAIRRLIEAPAAPSRRMGFRADNTQENA